MLTAALWPDGARNSTLPLSVVLPGFTSAISVIHPLPSAKCGKTRVVFGEGGAVKSATGSVVIRNSPRALVIPRRATTATGSVAFIVRLPFNTEGLLNGG